MGADIIVLGLSSITSGTCFVSLEWVGREGGLPSRPQGIVELTLLTVQPVWFPCQETVQPPFILRGYGRGGYNLGGSAEVEFWGHSPEVSIAGIGACQNSGSMNSGGAGGRAVAAAGTSPGPGLGIKVASGPSEALGGRRVIIQYGGGFRLSSSKSCRISCFIISQFLCH